MERSVASASFWRPTPSFPTDPRLDLLPYGTLPPVFATHRGLAVACAIIASPLSAQVPSLPEPTRVVRFTPPAQLPSRATNGTCATQSAVADNRSDAFSCTAGGMQYDPCFLTSHASQVLCDVDPRDPSSGMILNVTAALPATSDRSSHRTSAVWFFELADGSTCRPLLTPGRMVEGMTEVYTCRFALANGDIDAVLGDVDQRAPVWTIQKVQINKKIEPQTIKSATSAVVRAAWQ
jgi:hypothetical protein